jgi:chemotaxis protein histidine kinase CheA
MTDFKKYEALFVKNTKSLALELQEVLKVLEKTKTSKSDLLEGQRLAHVIKGSAAMMGLEVLSDSFAVGEKIFETAIQTDQVITLKAISRLNDNCQKILASKSFQDLKKQFAAVTF